MKQRFSSLDVQIITHELSTQLVSLRLANIYDLSSRIFLLKFAKPNHREQLLIDSGFRCHLTAFARATAAAPSPFVARLRKFLRTRRCTAVRQIGTDRVVEVEFSDGAFRLFLEFYAGGNIVLTDKELNIIALLRNVNEGEEHEQYRLGSVYNLSLRQNYGGVPELTRERVKAGLVKALERQRADAAKPGKKQGKKQGKDALRKALAVTTTEFPPVLIDHALEVTGFGREMEVERVVESDELLDRLMGSLRKAGEVVREIRGKEIVKGYILAKRKPGVQNAAPEKVEGEGEDGQQDGEEAKRQGLLYEDFHPFKPAQLSTDPATEFLEFDGFNKAVDEFFSSIEGQRLEGKLQEREEAAKRKIEQARREQDQRIEGLQQVQELNVRKAQAIESNVERVQETVDAVNELIASGMDWVDIGKLIENEQGRQNQVAQTIKLPLKLQENTITLLLSENDYVEEEEMADETESEASDSEAENTPAPKKTAKVEYKRLAIDVDLALSPWANARQYYDQRRTAATKQERTAQASQKALKSTEQKVMADLKKGLKQEKGVLRNVRKPLWFEKFIYFISSDGYLVLAGKDAQQNEMLYRRYLRKGDIYVHADLHGAASVIIKNNPKTPEAPIPPSTLAQAGNMSVCTSGAWESKAVMSAWWVESSQVSKTAPTGEYLTTGGFMIRGKKNFLPPAQLLLGFAVLFRISEESKARHLKHRLGNGEAGSAKEGAQPAISMQEDVNDDDDDEFPDAGHDGGDDEDDDFPDASAQGEIEPEADDDLPDARGDDRNDSSEAEDEPEAAKRSNPLQSGGPGAAEEFEGEQSDEEEDAEEDGSVVGSVADPADSGPVVDHASADKAFKGDSKAEAARSTAENAANKQQASSKPKPAQKPRGKRGKAKKLASKYAEQDDEDREMAMQLLGSRKAEERREAEQAAKAARAETAEEARARRRAQHEKAQKEGLEAEEIRRLNLEEGVEDLDEEEAAQLTHLDCFVGQPLPGDEILEAIPVCAPWQALGQYKYKAKMQPGQTKKGKAVREILSTWTRVTSEKKFTDVNSQDKEKVWPREAELIKGFKETEVVGTVPVKTLRVMMGGGAAAATAGGAKKGGAKGKGKGGRGGRGKKK